DPLAPRPGDGLDGDGRVLLDLGRGPRADGLGLRAASLELDARVQILGVLPHNDQIHLVVAGPDTGIKLAGPDARVEVQLMPERHVDTAEAGADGCGDGTLERVPVAPDGVEDAVGQGGAVLLHDVGPRLLD